MGDGPSDSSFCDAPTASRQASTTGTDKQPQPRWEDPAVRLMGARIAELEAIVARVVRDADAHLIYSTGVAKSVKWKP